MTVARLPAAVPQSGQIRLPHDCWDLLREFTDEMGGSTNSAAVTQVFRALELIRDTRPELLEFQFPAERQETMPGRLDLADKTWRIIQRFRKALGHKTISQTVATALRTIHRLKESNRLPIEIASLLFSKP